MNATHLHLLINHLAVVGTSLGIIVLLFAVVANKTNTYYAAYTVLAISGLGGVVAYFSGEGAEEAVEGLSGFVKSTIESHEDSAMLTVVSYVVLTVLTLAGIYISRVMADLQRTMGILVLISSAFAFAFAARTAWLGGKIRHTELSAGYSQPAQYKDSGFEVRR